MAGEGAGEGAGKSAAKIRGAGGSAGEGVAPHSFPRKPALAAPSPALPPAPRIFKHSSQHPEFPNSSQPFFGFPRLSILWEAARVATL